MKVVVILLLFIGMFFVINGVYEQKLNSVKQDKKIEYKFIPRTYYEEQVAGVDLNNKFNSMFDSASPWIGTNEAKTDL